MTWTLRTGVTFEGSGSLPRRRRSLGDGAWDHLTKKGKAESETTTRTERDILLRQNYQAPNPHPHLVAEPLEFAHHPSLNIWALNSLLNILNNITYEFYQLLFNKISKIFMLKI